MIKLLFILSLIVVQGVEAAKLPEYTIYYKRDMPKDVMGYYDRTTKNIYINSKMDYVDTQWTILHEIGHYDWWENKTEIYRTIFCKSWENKRFPYITAYGETSCVEYYAEYYTLQYIEKLYKKAFDKENFIK